MSTQIKHRQERSRFGGFFIYIFNYSLLQRNEAGRVSGSNTRTTVFNGLVCDGEFSKVMTDHLRLKRDKQIYNYKTVLIYASIISACQFLTLISTWLKVLPLYTPTIEPTISGRMTMSLRWVFTTSGFSMGGASFLALRRRFRKDWCFLLRPRFSLLLCLAQYSCISCSLRNKQIYQHRHRFSQNQCIQTLADFDQYMV